ncbi:hypothetical protein ACJMK2_036157 [Sinanodonta woodiana]|uniref:Uncharacterized protein n=1 Tax=Sinanodonta woodiana TaxID=1069815 RepID=A0ABD3WJT1_SINWO
MGKWYSFFTISDQIVLQGDTPCTRGASTTKNAIDANRLDTHCTNAHNNMEITKRRIISRENVGYREQSNNYLKRSDKIKSNNKKRINYKIESSEQIKQQQQEQPKQSAKRSSKATL